MMGVTFASVGPMLSMAAAPDIGLLGIYGSVIAAGNLRQSLPRLSSAGCCRCFPRWSPAPSSW